MCESCDAERARLTQLAIDNPQPCIVCDNPKVAGVGTWIPDKRRRLAAGGTDKETPFFAFCLCVDHIEVTQENEKLVTQAVLRAIRTGRKMDS